MHYVLFKGNTFISNKRLRLAKNQAKAKQLKIGKKSSKSHTYDIDLGLDMYTNTVNIKSISMMVLKCIKQHLSNI